MKNYISFFFFYIFSFFAHSASFELIELDASEVYSSSINYLENFNVGEISKRFFFTKVGRENLKSYLYSLPKESAGLIYIKNCPTGSHFLNFKLPPIYSEKIIISDNTENEIIDFNYFITQDSNYININYFYIWSTSNTIQNVSTHKRMNTESEYHARKKFKWITLNPKNFKDEQATILQCDMPTPSSTIANIKKTPGQTFHAYTPKIDQ